MNLFHLAVGALIGAAWPLWSRIRNTIFLPQVDLGYEIHEALSYNHTTGHFTFRNIRYAQAPIGALRHAPPVAPAGTNPEVQRGNESRICPQASQDIPGTTEDCLFLNVIVPRSVFNRRGKCKADVTLHFVMANDVPGAIVDKESRFREGLGENVFVSANYRLGRLAQLEPSLAGELGGDCADLGCLDRGLAVEWVRKYIHLFGGNGKRVFTIETSWS
ncbi:predicted protein [Aspergillus terreus NIH2624]|uniref:Carboxylesterase type B domain-containing protein n=1 Tax=Aspergillus terreus (strain NIH 2624 / FGSC A1156) TaxID=341663 RepID=Q0CJR9_ASPTN|nr:uncharacterized protein ATEG_06065 [Aspergillus terreus NIH2624]EAU33826.1 predicted protein [Aspergillus terreus NIH2624]